MDRAMAERVPRELLSEAQHERARAEAQLLQERADMDERQRKCEAGKEAAVQELSARIAQASRLWCKAPMAPCDGAWHIDQAGERRASRRVRRDAWRCPKPPRPPAVREPSAVRETGLALNRGRARCDAWRCPKPPRPPAVRGAVPNRRRCERAAEVRETRRDSADARLTAKETDWQETGKQGGHKLRGGEHCRSMD